MTRERALALLALLPALLAAAAQSASPWARSLRGLGPVAARLEAREAGANAPREHLLVLHPAALRAAAVYLPRPPEGGVPSGPVLRVRLPSLDEESDPPLEAARALEAALRSPRAWARLAREAAGAAFAGEPGAFDALLLALELRRLPGGRLEPVWAAPGAAGEGLLRDRLEGRAPAPREGAPVVEVLNGSQAPGLASDAAKMLRLRGVDVLASASSPRPRRRTAVYDRTGDFARAAGVAALLGCPGTRAVTRPDPSRVVEVSVELGEDCAAAAGSRNF